MEVICTEKANKKAGVLATEDNMQRSREIAKRLLELVAGRRVLYFSIESMSFPRNSSVAAKMALSYGALAMLATQLNVPIVQASPQKIKEMLCGHKKATKEEVEVAVIKRYGRKLNQMFDIACQPMQLTKKQQFDLREHAFDSVAAFVMSLESDVARMARQFAGDPIGQAVMQQRIDAPVRRRRGQPL